MLVPHDQAGADVPADPEASTSVCGLAGKLATANGLSNQSVMPMPPFYATLPCLPTKWPGMTLFQPASVRCRQRELMRI